MCKRRSNKTFQKLQSKNTKLSNAMCYEYINFEHHFLIKIKQSITMIKKLLTFHIVLFLLFSISESYADEGMWIPSEIDSSILDLESLNITLEDIYSVKQSSLKDAVVLFGGGCTGEIVSKNGLLFTNHHCGYSYVVKHSDTINDYLNNGFWAHSYDEELINPGLTVSIVQYMTEVTDKIVYNLSDTMSMEKRNKVANQNIQDLLKNRSKLTDSELFVIPFYEGNAFYLISLITYKDIRLVGAPPRCIGEFGQESDNWMWPRHSGDFSVFRIYADSSNQPSDYNASNQPYRPQKHLNINTNGVKENDFTMVYGFPGRTFEYLTSYEVNQRINKVNPLRIQYREAYLDILKNYMSKSKSDLLTYTSKYNRVSNYYKKMIGQNMGLEKVNILMKKQNFEKLCAERDPGTLPYHYKKVLTDIGTLINEKEEFALENVSQYELSQMIGALNKHFSLYDNSGNPMTKDELISQLNSAKGVLTNPKKNQKLEKEVFFELMNLYLNAPRNKANAFFEKYLNDRYNGNLHELYRDVYENSILVNDKKYEKLIHKNAKSIVKTFSKDPLYILSQAFHNSEYQKFEQEDKVISEKLEVLDRQYMYLIKYLVPERKYYPNANSTLRLAHGNIKGYTNYSNEEMPYYTSAKSLLEKHASEAHKNSEYFILEDYLNLLESGNFAPYGKEDLNVCFIATNHTTGGNSGSPVLNKNGELIGINFDRSWESTMSDFYYNPEICRNIAVDIRYILFVIDKYAHCQHIIKDLSIVN